jgi:hypothetical protein
MRRWASGGLSWVPCAPATTPRPSLRAAPRPPLKPAASKLAWFLSRGRCATPPIKMSEGESRLCFGIGIRPGCLFLPACTSSHQLALYLTHPCPLHSPHPPPLPRLKPAWVAPKTAPPPGGLSDQGHCGVSRAIRAAGSGMGLGGCGRLRFTHWGKALDPGRAWTWNHHHQRSSRSRKRRGVWAAGIKGETGTGWSSSRSAPSCPPPPPPPCATPLATTGIICLNNTRSCHWRSHHGWQQIRGCVEGEVWWLGLCLCWVSPLPPLRACWARPLLSSYCQEQNQTRLGMVHARSGCFVGCRSVQTLVVRVAVLCILNGITCG